MIIGKNYIGGEQSAVGDISFRTKDPQNDTENEYIFYEATREEVDLAAEKAKAAFEIYKNFEGSVKADFLEAIADEIEALGDSLLKVYVQESGLPQKRAEGERGRTLGQLRSFAVMLREGSWAEAIISKEEGKPDLRRMLVPIGPVAVFGASNFPLAFSTAGGDTASALAAGCPVIVKSHPLHAGTGEMVSAAITRAADKTGMPKGVFSNLNSSGIKVGQWLVKHPDIKAVGFTGSKKAGTALCKLAAEREEPIPVYAEMGSVNPVLILPSSVRDKAEYWAGQYAQSITSGSGQFCTKPGLILAIDDENFDVFARNLGEAVEKISPGCMLHSSIKDKYDSDKANVLSQKGYTVIGESPEEVSGNCGTHQVILVSAEEFLKNKAFHQEVFGPFSVLVKSRNKEELASVLRSLEGQLTGTVLNAADDDLDIFRDHIETLKTKVGRLIYNGIPTGVEVSPAMTHGGPFPATSDSKFTSVGITSVKRWVRPVTFQDWPDKFLPKELQAENPLGIQRTINSKLSSDSI